MYNNNGFTLPFFAGYWMGATSSATKWPSFTSIDPSAASPSATTYTHWGAAPPPPGGISGRRPPGLLRAAQPRWQGA
jgi:hypothetical protein